MADVSLKEKAYCKMLLHAVKYPHCAVNGVLLAEKPKSYAAAASALTTTTTTTGKSTTSLIVDCVPLFHVGNGLTPMVEVALTQIDYYCKEKGLVLAGYYQANVNVKDNTPDYFARRIADKIHEGYNDAVLIMVDNEKLSLDCNEPALNLFTFAEGKWKPREKSNILEKERKSLAALASLLQSKSHRTLIDFDNHLDNVALSWQNVSLNEEISRLL